MVIHFNRTLQEALKQIDYQNNFREFLVHEEDEQCDHSQEHLIKKYGDAKWSVVDLLNEKFNSKFDLYNWLYHNQEDEVAYFLNEAGSNCLNHSQFKAPHVFRVWMGSKGFVLAIQQKGEGFTALEVENKKIMTNEGAAFQFFRDCNNKIFFDDPNNTKIVFMECLF